MACGCMEHLMECLDVPCVVCVQEATLLNGSPLRQHQSSSRGRPGSSGAGSVDRSSLVYTRMIRMAAAIQQVSSSRGHGMSASTH